jgi:hypothetical protein
VTLIPYHGEPAQDKKEIFRGEPKSGTTGLILKRATCWTRESRKTGEFRGPAVEWSVAALHLALKAGVGTEVPFT